MHSTERWQSWEDAEFTVSYPQVVIGSTEVVQVAIIPLGGANFGNFLPVLALAQIATFWDASVDLNSWQQISRTLFWAPSTKSRREKN